MAKIETTQHEWVALSKEPVIVLKHPDRDEVTVIGDPDTPPIVYYGCNHCDTVLEENGDNIFSPCPGQAQ